MNGMKTRLEDERLSKEKETFPSIFIYPCPLHSSIKKEDGVAKPDNDAHGGGSL